MTVLIPGTYDSADSWDYFTKRRRKKD